jgi:heme oxygenase
MLRQATRAEHERVDALFSQFDLSSRAGYGRFLKAQAAAFLPVEAALDRGPGDAAVPDWPQRRRGDLIRADLADLGIDATPLPPPAIGDGFAALGTIYVLEGSRLGGSLLRRSVPAGLPARFLSAASPEAWRTLIAHLEEKLTTPESRLIAIKAAQAVFALFERGGQHQLEQA